MCAPAASWRTGTSRMACSSSAAANGSISGDGRPKTKRPPSFARQRASSRPPFSSAIGHLLVRLIRAGPAGPAHKAWWPPARLVAVITGRKDPRTPSVHAHESPRRPPDAALFGVERMRMADFRRDTLAAVRTQRAKRRIGLGSELGPLLGHRDRPPPTLAAGRASVARLHLNLDIGSLYAHRVRRYAARRRRTQHGAGFDVVDRSVPGARHLLARHLALAQRAAAVRAGVVDRIEAPLEVEEGDLLPGHLDTLRLARSEVGGARDLDELRHGSLLPRSEPDHHPPATL